MPRQDVVRAASGRPGRPAVSPPSPDPGSRRQGRQDSGLPMRENEGMVVVRGVVWLGVPEGAEEEEAEAGRLRPRNPALHLLGYPHGPRILDALRSGGR